LPRAASHHFGARGLQSAGFLMEKAEPVPEDDLRDGAGRAGIEPGISTVLDAQWRFCSDHAPSRNDGVLSAPLFQTSAKNGIAQLGTVERA
jgi:hypothetical protein